MSIGDEQSRPGSLGLIFVSLAQLMIALDATIMNVALPSLQRSLGFADNERQWVISAYTLAFGSLLLLGGRLSDRIGQRRAFSIGLLGFAAVSWLGGMSQNLPTLCAARAAQGAFAALLAPSTLALIAAHAQATGERGKTFALFGAIAGSGGVAGLVLGGFLTSHFSWRVCLWVNIPIALIAAFGSRTAGQRTAPASGRLDISGAVLATLSVGLLVAACSSLSAPQRSLSALLLPVAAAVSCALFVWHESRAEQPLLPARIWKDRERAGAYVAAGFAVAGMLGLFLSLTYYFQAVLKYTPLQAGLAFLPLSAAVFGSAQVVARLLPRLGERTLIVFGLLIASAATLLLGQLGSNTSYLTHLLPAEIILGIGMGAVFTPAISAATANVSRSDAGVAAALVQACQQIGGAVGVSVLNAIATSGARASDAAHGYANATRAAAVILIVAAFLSAGLMRRPGPTKQPLTNS